MRKFISILKGVTMSENKVQVFNKRGQLVDCDSNIVPDGHGVRVPVMLMDSVQRAVAEDLRVTDAFGAAAGHRPGYVFDHRLTEAREARDAAYSECVKRLEDAWRSPSATAPSPVSERMLDTRDAAYEAHNAWLRDAWKTAR